ncbi:MAG: ABC transporter substrate-binding protein [Candidatus ainarchaeum sp.]|nr:ABC transporter substrate-binding protein [Candidatus ainarchaeum sp.]
MKTKILLGIAIIAVVAAVFLAGCASNSQGEETIKIGALLPLTGSAAYIGQDVQTAIQIASEDLAKEGISVEIVYDDHQGISANAVTSAQKLISDNANGLFVVMSSPSAAVAPVAEENRIVMISDSSADGSALKYDFVFKDYASLRQDCGFLLKEAKKRGFNAGALLPNFESGIGCSTGLKEVDEKIPIELFNIDATDIRTEITKLKSKGIDFLIIYGVKDNIINILKQTKELGFSPKIGCISISVTCGAQEVISVAPDVLQGAWGTQSKASVNPDTQAFNDFSKKYFDKTGKKPSLDFAIYAYDDIILLAKALNECHNDSECTKNKLLEIKNFEGAGGTLSFDEKGIGKRESIIMKFENGKFVEYGGAQ